MRSHSGFGSAGRAGMLVIASTGAKSTAPITAPVPAPTPPLAAPNAAPDAAPSVAPQISASTSRPERLRRRRSVSAITGQYRGGGAITSSGSHTIGAMERRDLAVTLAG